MKLRSIFCAWHEPTKEKKEVDRFFLSCWTLLKTSMFLVMYQALVMFRGGEGECRVLLSRALVSLASQFVRGLSHAPLCPTSAFLCILFLQCVFSTKDSPLHIAKLLFCPPLAKLLKELFLCPCLFPRIQECQCLSRTFVRSWSKWDCNYLHDLWSKSYRNQH